MDYARAQSRHRENKTVVSCSLRLLGRDALDFITESFISSHTLCFFSSWPCVHLWHCLYKMMWNVCFFICCIYLRNVPEWWSSLFSGHLTFLEAIYPIYLLFYRSIFKIIDEDLLVLQYLMVIWERRMLFSKGSSWENYAKITVQLLTKLSQILFLVSLQSQKNA